MSARPRIRRLFSALALATGFALAGGVAASADVTYTLLSGTAVLLSTSTTSGNGGNTSSTSSMTNIFSPAVPVDYHRSGGEPTLVVDRYPFTKPFSCGASLNPVACQQQTACSQTATSASPCYIDAPYVSNPLGVGYPGFSEFFKSDDRGQTFRVPPHDQIFGTPLTTQGSGGGDSHQAVGQSTHSIFLVDLSGYCVTMNISRDLGESWSSNKLGCEANPGAIDDRPWVAADETGGLQNVYMNVNNDSGCLVTSVPGCAIVFVKSTDDGGSNTPADFAASPCNDATAFSFVPTTGSTTACPDPVDPNFYIAGPVTVDTSPTSPNWHNLYIPFERNVSGDFQLWVAISTDQGTSWTRQEVANIGPHDPANIFPQLTVDTGGNLYYTWSQAQYSNSDVTKEGEQDIYYTYSQGAGLTGTWVPPIDLTNEVGDSAVFPWMVAGDPGQVDLVFYKSNSGLNSNVYGGQVWNVYFSQSQNALNGGKDFKPVQISDHPNNIGSICTQGTACGGSDSRALLDFFTVDVDHFGAAEVSWADDNDSRGDTRDRFSHQLMGNGVYKNVNLSQEPEWPVTNHQVTDPAGDVFDANGLRQATPLKAQCNSMDLLGTSSSRNNDLLTIGLTLAAPPSGVNAIACSDAVTTGGLWGAEFWASSSPDVSQDAPNPNDNFYVAFRDNPPDGAPRVEGGRVNNIALTLEQDEFHQIEAGTLGGTCLTSAGTPAPGVTGTCTITLTVSLSGLDIKSGAGLYGITGLAVYYFGSEITPPGFRVPLGLSNQADAAAPFDDEGTGTTTT